MTSVTNIVRVKSECVFTSHVSIESAMLYHVLSMLWVLPRSPWAVSTFRESLVRLTSLVECLFLSLLCHSLYLMIFGMKIRNCFVIPGSLLHAGSVVHS